MLATSCGSLPALRPSLNFPPDMLLRAQGVKVAFFDVDGVLTDGGLYMSGDGEQIKRFNTLDGHGLKLLQQAGITPAHFGTEDKRPAAEITLQALGLDWREAAAMGDDWPDLAVMRRVAISCAPVNAHVEVKAQAHFITQAPGGQGAAREFCDLLLVASGSYARLLHACAQ
jgi:3-deoxy-D-manno-octulosonate 8-phosphate phosphatase (KDO 8-P phosphatase)